MNKDVLLRMMNIHKRFSGVYALEKVDFELQEGEVHALLGENGAGKSTLIKILGGIYKADLGDIYINGEKKDIGSVFDARKNGIAIIHQELVLVPHMSVAENIFLGREPVSGTFVDKARMNADTEVLLKTYSLGFSAQTPVADLTIAQQQMVEIIKAVSCNSRILVMDEPTSSISEKEVSVLFGIIRALTARKVGIIYISHKMSELEQICDRVTVLRDGRTVGTEEMARTTKDLLISRMVGRKLEQYYTREFQPQGQIVLRAEHICDGNLVKDVSFELHRGEILGFAGLVGAGRSETMKCLFGLTRKFTGILSLNGQNVHFSSATSAIRHGVALVPEDRKLEGLYHVQSVQFNTTIEVLKEFITGIFRSPRVESEITGTYAEMMNIKTPSLTEPVSHLSGGNQQKVMIGRWLATKPSILILDEPTRGIDVGAKAEIYSIMNTLAKQGIAIIMISSELPEIINMSDRICVMADGKIKGCLSHYGITQEAVMKLAAE